MEDKKNPYLKTIAQDEWNSIQGYHIENSIAWRNIAILAIIISLIVALYAMYMVNQDKHKVIVFEKDSLGNITTLGLATSTFNIDNKIIAHELVNFIYALREVPLDVNLKKKNIELVHKMIDYKIKNQIDQLILKQYLNARENPIYVDINNINPIEGGKSWVIRWTETIGNDKNQGNNVTHWSTTLTFTRLETVEPDIQIANPIGLFVTYISPSEDIGG